MSHMSHLYLEESREQLAADVDARTPRTKPKQRVRGCRRMRRSAAYVVCVVDLRLKYPGYEMHRTRRNHGRKSRKAEVVRRARQAYERFRDY